MKNNQKKKTNFLVILKKRYVPAPFFFLLCDAALRILFHSGLRKKKIPGFTNRDLIFFELKILTISVIHLRNSFTKNKGLLFLSSL